MGMSFCMVERVMLKHIQAMLPCGWSFVGSLLIILLSDNIKNIGISIGM